MMMHNNERKIQCPTCNKKFIKNTNFKVITKSLYLENIKLKQSFYFIGTLANSHR